MLLVFLSASMFALCTPLAKFSYDAGAEPMQVIILRTIMTILVGVLMARAMHGSWWAIFGRINKPFLALLSGFFAVFQGVAYVISVKYIPVGLAAILFFMWPIFVAILAPRIFEKRWPNITTLLIFIGAFVGLAIAIGPQWQTLNILGILAALGGAVGFAGYVISLKACLQDNPPSAMIILGMPPSLLPILVYVGVDGGSFWPSQDLAIWGLVLGSVTFVLGVLFQLGALKRVRAQDAALLYNIEPIISILFAALLLGERLHPSQYFGGAIIFAMLILYNRLGLRREL